MSGIPFKRDVEFEYGMVDQISPLIRRVIAKNPGPFTLHGTGTYIVGSGNVAVIDPGPLDQDHIDAIVRATEGETITHIVVTHTHRDHSPAAAPLQKLTNAPTYGFGPHGSGRIDTGGGSSEEGADKDFDPDHKLQDGDLVEGDGWTLQAVYTPGHTSNHLCFTLKEESILFSGDHVMGWSTTIVSPPDGDMARYKASLVKLLDMDHVRYWPTHGPAIEEPQDYVRSYLAHREARDAQILNCLKGGEGHIPAMVKVMYKDVPESLHGAAARSVLSHMIEMVDRGVVAYDGDLGLDANYRLNS